MVRASALHSLLGSRPAGGCYGEPKRVPSCQPDSPLGHQDLEQGQLPCNVAHADLKAAASRGQRWRWNLTRRRHTNGRQDPCATFHLPRNLHTSLRQLLRQAGLGPSCTRMKAIRHPRRRHRAKRFLRAGQMFQNRPAGVGFAAGRYLVDSRKTPPKPLATAASSRQGTTRQCARTASTRATKLCPAFPCNESHAAGVGREHSISRCCRGVEAHSTKAGGRFFFPTHQARGGGQWSLLGFPLAPDAPPSAPLVRPPRARKIRTPPPLLTA